MRNKLTAAIESTYGVVPTPIGRTSLALIKGDERYLFVFDDDHRAEVLRVMGRFASNPDLTFNWYDAAVLSQKVQIQSGEI